MENKTKVAIIGLGPRGYHMTKCVIARIEAVEITALCDIYPDRVEEAVKAIEEAKGYRPFGTTNYKEILVRDDVEMVYIATGWDAHIRIAIDALKAGKATGLEVGGAYSIGELDALVSTQESTGTPFMLMENCCYNNDELFATAAARAGLFGTVVHCSGAYGHDLRYGLARSNIDRHYRLREYELRNGENYPTHELGPIAKLLNINRGNRMISLVSVASKACGLKEYIDKRADIKEKDGTLESIHINQGDIVNTIITCQNGETITLKLDTTLPRSYSREFTVRGTKGLYSQDTNSVFLDGMKEHWEPVKYVRDYLDNAKEYYDEYMPKVWTEMTEEAKKSGHGGMDGVMFSEFVRAYREGREMPIDVYDCAAWMCITVLSEQSIAMGGVPQPIPDFTHGKWLTRLPKDVIDLKKE